MIVAYWHGWVPSNVTPDLMDKLFTLIQIGLGGYVVGRSGEKIAETIINKNVVN